MGYLSERFGNLQFNNEAEVSNNFVLPLFTEFLGYKDIEIIPEHLFPSVKIPLNRDKYLSGDDVKIKPDFVIASDGDLTDKQNIVFIFDSKGPHERLDEYLQQLISYSLAMQVNLIAVSNGREFRVYSANELIFQSNTIEDLDLQFSELYKLLHKDKSSLSATERIQSLNLQMALGKTLIHKESEQKKKIAIRNSEFKPYLTKIINSSNQPEFPPSIAEAFGIELKLISPQRLYSFARIQDESFTKKNEYKNFYEIVKEVDKSSIIIVGESGIGKSSMIKQVEYIFSMRCVNNESEVIPVYIRLGYFSPSNNLEKMILSRLRGMGCAITEAQLYALFQQKRLILLLDAFDEVTDKYVFDLHKEIENLKNEYNCFFVITTRPLRIPKMPRITKYEVQPLSLQKIRLFSEDYLGKESQIFLNEIADRDLESIASNTLILTLIIIQFKQNRTIPISRMQVIDGIVRELESRSEYKLFRYARPIDWKTKHYLLSELSYYTSMEGDSYTLDTEKADKYLIAMLDELNQKHNLSGIELSEVYSQMEETGLIRNRDVEISFWHHIFLEYLTSFAVARRVQSGEIQIAEVIKSTKWEEILPSVVVRSSSSEDILEQIFLQNGFTAGKAIIESDIKQGEFYKRIIDFLFIKGVSTQKAIRQIALGMIKKIEGNYIDDRLIKLLETLEYKENVQYEDLLKTSLVEIAKRKLPKAKVIVRNYMNWEPQNPSNWIFGDKSTLAYIIEALSWFDDYDSQLLIMKFWKNRLDMETGDACRDALIRMSNRGQLKKQITNDLFEWLRKISIKEKKSSERNSDSFSFSKVTSIGSVLIASHDFGIANRLVDELVTVEESSMIVRDLIKILITYKEPQIIDRVIQQVKIHRMNSSICARFVEVLSETEGAVPIDVFLDIAQDEIPSSAKAVAIRGLGKYTFDLVAGAVLTAIHPPEYSRLLEAIKSYYVNLVSRTYTKDELTTFFADYINSPNLSDENRSLMLSLFEEAEPYDFLSKICDHNLPDEIKNILIHSYKDISSTLIQDVIIHMLFSAPYEYLLNSGPSRYAMVQEEVIKVLDKYKQIPTLLRKENQPGLWVNTSVQKLFSIIRRDNILEMQPFVEWYIATRISNDNPLIKRTVVEAAWVLAEFGRTVKAKEIIETIFRETDYNGQSGSWILGDILEGVHLLNEEYSLKFIEKIFLDKKLIDLPLILSYCINALCNVGGKRSLYLLISIVEDTLYQEKRILETDDALGAISQISLADLEGWLISLLEKIEKDEQRVQEIILQKIIILLGSIGTTQTVQFLQKNYLDHKSERIKYVTFRVIKKINNTQETVWWNGEEIPNEL